MHAILISMRTGTALYRASFGQGSGPILISEIDCEFRDEAPLLEGCGWSASATGRCTHAEDAGVRCEGRTNLCDYEGAIRVGDASSVMQGAVEVCINGTWGGICSEDWDNRDASVVCRQLGFSSNGTVAFFVVLFL